MLGTAAWYVGKRLCFILAALCLTAVSAGATALSSPETQRRDVDLRPVRSFPAIDELRIGVLEPIDGPNGDKLGAPDVNVELLFGRFGPEYQSSFLNHLLRPRLDLGTSISTSGDTSEFYVGLTWDVFLTKSLFLEGSAGGALHSDDDHAFGCSANFRESGSVGVMLSERWDMSFTVDHMSNANLCGENRGLTDVGILLGRKW